jgi:hypothetical protein
MSKTHLVFLVLLTIGACKKPEPTEIIDPVAIGEVRLNQFQVIGSHNSYKQLMDPAMFDSLLTIKSAFPDSPLELDYGHETLTDQLEIYGIRQFELDIYHDPEGGRFYNRVGLDLILGEDPASNEAELLEPGLKLIHIPDIDFETSQLTFIGALQEIRDWSSDHPAHFPIMILIEAKTESINDWLPGWGFTESLPVDLDFLSTIDAEIQEVFSADELLVPQTVKGNFATLNDAVIQRGWPTLSESRGKVFFCFNNGGGQASLYLSMHPEIATQLMFTVSPAGSDRSAFLMANNPSDVAENEVNGGYLIRTRADAGTWQARNGDYSQMNVAFQSEAQFISTDYYRPDSRYVNDAGWTDYQVVFSNGSMIRVNPKLGLSVVGEVE